MWILFLSKGRWSEGHSGKLGCSQPLDEGFKAWLCYDIENEFPDPQVYPNGNNPQRDTLKLHEGTALSALFLNCVPVLIIMLRIVGTVNAL